MNIETFKRAKIIINQIDEISFTIKQLDRSIATHLGQRMNVKINGAICNIDYNTYCKLFEVLELKKEELEEELSKL